MKNISIKLLLIGLIVVRASKSSSNSEENKENSLMFNKDKKIEQCECSKIDKCIEIEHKQFRPCVDNCVNKLRNSDWDEKAGHKCFFVKEEQQKVPICLQEFKNLTCASSSGVMLNKNETMHRFPFKHYKEKGQKNNNTETNKKLSLLHPPPPFGMNRRQFHKFLNNVFGNSEKAYKKCVKKCFIEHGRSKCYRKLNCAKRRLSGKELEMTISKCSGEKFESADERREKFCSCLTKSGIKNINCNLSKTNESDLDEHNEI